MPAFVPRRPAWLTHALINTIGVRVPRAGARFFPDLLFRKPTPHNQPPTLYLTFDDGPDPESGGTTALLNLLDAHDIAATFFLIGAHAKRDPGLVRAYVEGGHAIGNHSWTHPNLWETPPEETRRELDDTTALLEDLTGERVTLMRPPYGRFSPSARTWAQETGHQIVMWDVMPGDFLPSATSEGVRAHLARFARPGSIIVLHEGGQARSLTPRVIGDVLARYRAEGWRFARL
ncbi:MAG: polysaccharide deacetylase family protein [Bacteroidota bacterium]